MSGIELTKVVIIPLVLALVGIGGTCAITSYQAKHTEEMSRVQRESAGEIARAERKSAEALASRELGVEVLRLFADRIVEEDPKARELAVSLLQVVNPELALVLAADIAENDQNDDVRSAAGRVVRAAAVARAAELVEEFSGRQRESASDEIVALHNASAEEERRSIAGILVDALLLENEEMSYRVNIYVARTLSLLEPVWAGTADQKSRVEGLKQSGSYRDATFRSRVDDALRNYREIAHG